MNMAAAPTFFVPAAPTEMQESVYADLAKLCNCAVPDFGKRIFTIVFVHEGEEWTATVGEKLRGIRHQIIKSQVMKSQQGRPVGDPALVLAIFPGAPFMVVTNHRIAGSVGSAWQNPFLAGEPKSVTYFAVAK
jgi:hypothetical protein